MSSLQRVRVNGIDSCFDAQGEGPWLVLSHSLACDRTMWDEQTAALIPSFRVLRYDTRGHGGSTATPAPYSLELLADDLKGLLGTLGIERPHFAGLSMGGMIGQVCALRYPGIFRTLTLCDTTSCYPPGTEKVWGERIRTAREQGMAALVDPTLERWFTESFRRARPEVMRRFGGLISSTPVEGYVGCSEALVHINVTARLGALRVPALVVVGEHDPGTPLAMAQDTHAAMPGSELAVIAGAAHISNVERPVEFTALLASFLQKHRSD